MTAVARIEIDGTIPETGETYETPWAGTVTVQTIASDRTAPYYGVAYDRDDPALPIAWTVEFAGDRANAERIVRNADAICSVVERHGRRARISVAFDGDAMTVREYDWSAWTETIEGAE